MDENKRLNDNLRLFEALAQRNLQDITTHPHNKDFFIGKVQAYRLCAKCLEEQLLNIWRYENGNK